MKTTPKTTHETPPPPQKIFPLERPDSKKNIEVEKQDQAKKK